jgi:hypothetical protein
VRSSAGDIAKQRCLADPRLAEHNSGSTAASDRTDQGLQQQPFPGSPD